MRIGSNYHIMPTIRKIFGGGHTKNTDATVKWAKNQVKPLQETFTSTKEMFAYAKERCLADLSRRKPREHALLLDLKENRVLAEYVGNSNSCQLDNIESYPINSKNTVIFHGHLDNMPISGVDVYFLLNNNVNQVIAINEKGEFSIIEKVSHAKSNEEIKKAYEIYEQKSIENYDRYYDNRAISRYLYKAAKNDLLNKCSESMGLRYLTNYSIFRNK